MIEDINDSIRSIRRRLDELETGNTGRRTGRSRRGNIQNRPAIPPRVGGRRTRRGRRKKRTRRRRKSRRKSKGRKRRRKKRTKRRR